MRISTVSSRELDRHTGRVKKAADLGPVYITHRGGIAFVLLTVEDYQKMAEAAKLESDQMKAQSE